jgi:hypothetical protein
MGRQDELTPFQRSLQSKNGSIGANTTPAVPFLGQRGQNPLGGGMGGWSSSATHPSVGNAPQAAPSPNEVVNDRFGNWSSPANVAPQNAPGSPTSFNDRFGKWGSAPADSFDNSNSPVLRYLEKHRRSVLPGAPGPQPSPRTASVPAAPSGPIAPGGGNDGFDDTSGLPSWMRNALAYQPENESRGWGTVPADDSDDSRSPVLRELKKYRSSAAVGGSPPFPAQSDTSVFDIGAPAVPFVPPTQNPLAPAPPASFGGKWGAVGPTSAPVGPSQQMSSPQGGGTKPLDRKDIRILARVTPDGEKIFPPNSIPNTPAPPQPNRPLGLVSGKPMPEYPILPMVFGLPDRSPASDDNMDDWFNRWRPLMRQ